MNTNTLFKDELQTDVTYKFLFLINNEIESFVPVWQFWNWNPPIISYCLQWRGNILSDFFRSIYVFLNLKIIQKIIAIPKPSKNYVCDKNKMVFRKRFEKIWNVFIFSLKNQTTYILVRYQTKSHLFSN